MKESNNHFGIIEYAKTFLYDFKDFELNLVDLAIFSQLSYYDFSIFPNNLKIIDLFDHSKIDAFLQRPSFSQLDYDLLTSVAGNPRFKNVCISDYVNEFSFENTKQFSAVTFTVLNKIKIVVFRGTDASLVGWKENFDMSYNVPVLAQLSAERYLKDIIKNNKKSHFYVVGHSKGGNLALYSFSSLTKKEKQCVIKAVSFDGPGLNNNYLNLLNFEIDKEKYLHVVPTQSIIGQLLPIENISRLIISSKGKLFSQHMLFNWEVNGDHFVVSNEISSSLLKFMKGFNNWIESVDEQSRALFVETIYNLINDTCVENVKDITSQGIGYYFKLLTRFAFLPPEQKNILVKEIKPMLSYLKQAFKED